MARLTPGRLRVVGFIRSFTKKNGYAPTFDEIAHHLGLAKPTVQQYIRALEQLGVIARRRYAHRSLEVVDAEQAGAASVRLPLVGLIAAGEPIEAIEDVQIVDVAEALNLPVGVVAGGGRGGEFFLLRVKGDSMVEDGILDGDYVVVCKSATAENGQTVVALLSDGTATLKRFYRQKNRIKLQPANARMKPIFATQVTIQGIVRGVVRPVR